MRAGSQRSGKLLLLAFYPPLGRMAPLSIAPCRPQGVRNLSLFPSFFFFLSFFIPVSAILPALRVLSLPGLL